MQVLLWRGWNNLYRFPGSFGSLRTHGIGGTCAQLLWHARNLGILGARVQVLGVAAHDSVEEGIEFIGAGDRSAQIAAIRSGRVRVPDVILLEGAFDGAGTFREVFPSAAIVHVGQNIDRTGAARAFANLPLVDTIAFVSPGQLAHYCAQRPDFMHRFALIRNAVPWDWLVAPLELGPVVPHTVLWVGAWTKLGLRAWACTMERVLQKYKSARWTLLGPEHGEHVSGRLPANILAGLHFPPGAVRTDSLPLEGVYREMSRSQVVIVSLGNETACISALDAHAVGRPVVSGNDIVFRFTNPGQTGLRVFSPEERFRALSTLLDDAPLCDALGRNGRTLVQNQFAECHQRADIQETIELAVMHRRMGSIGDARQPSKLASALLRLREKIQRRVPGWKF